MYKDKIFHSLASNRTIASALPQAIGFILFLSIPFTVFWILFIHDKYPYLDENMAVYNAIFWFIPTVYFIIKNYPISMLFYKNAWYVEGANTYSFNSRHHKHSKPLLSLSRLRNSPINSWHSESSIIN